MRAPTPVTNRAMVTDNGSTRKPTSTCSPPEGTHENSVWSKARCSCPLPMRARNTPHVTRNDREIRAVATQPASGSPRRRPDARRMANPASGRAGISQAACSIVGGPASALEEGDVVGGGLGPAAEDGHDDGQADHHFGRGHDQHEEHDRLAPDVVEHAG